MVKVVDDLTFALFVEIFHGLVEIHGVEFGQIRDVEMFSFVLHMSVSGWVIQRVL